MGSRTARAAGLLLGWLADEAFGDPARLHPVAGFGSAAAALERKTYAGSRAAGTGHVAVLVTTTAAAGLLIERGTRSRPWLQTLLTAVATWTVLGGRSLRREAEAIRQLVAVDDLPGARHRIRNLVGRDPSELDADDLARATIESVAENTADAVVAPIAWGAVAGVPGLLTYRAINTLDAMIGHRNARYTRFGWAAARLDDVANWVPARVAALLTAAAAPIVGGHPGTALRTVATDAHRHPSPNAGRVEAAFAGALGIRLGGINAYAGQVEDRGTLGDGPRPTVADIPRANRLAASVAALSTALACFALARGGLRWFSHKQ
ncbi:MAG: cobalamin biosynthesis protein [Propionibacteriaceae bacterium]|nr:cobalamin biosynthesis protein [Propionibacteriaceae bacterium]